MQIDDDKRLPVRLRGQIESTKYLLRYTNEMTKVLEPGLRFGFREHLCELEEKLEGFRENARKLLHSDKQEASAVAGGDR